MVEHRHRIRRPGSHLLVVASVAALFAAVAPGGASHLSGVTLAADASEASIDAAVHAREKYGLGDERARARSVLDQVPIAESQRWGIPMTSAEAEQVDMPGRLRFETRVHDEVLPYVTSLDGFGGAWFDQRHNGRLVVRIKNPSPRIEDEIRARMPAASRGLVIEDAAHTRRELERAYERAFDAWEARYPRLAIEGFAIDDEHNALIVNAPPSDVDEVRNRVDEFSQDLGVKVRVVATGRGRDLAANCGEGDDRSHCHLPLKAGVQIYGGHLWNAQLPCSMGFHIWVPDAEVNNNPHRQFLTAGHCTYLANQWYHWRVGGDGHIGAEKNTQYDNSFARDIARVGISADGEISFRIFGELTPEVVHQPRSAVQGETLCMSLPRYNTNLTPQNQNGQGIITCGTVASTGQSWKSETANRIVHGASIDSNEGKTARGGDSGSPVYKLLFQAGGTLHLYPIGILDHERYDNANQSPCPANAYGCHDFYFASIEAAFNHAEWDDIHIYD